MVIREGLSYDDVLLEPAYSTVETREEIDLSTGFVEGDFRFEHPIIPANMKDVAGFELLFEQAESGGLCLLHRFQDVGDQLIQFSELGRPVVIGPSRKGFLTRPLGREVPAPERDWPTAAAVATAVLAGAHIVRVHAAREMVEVVRVADEIRKYHREH